VADPTSEEVSTWHLLNSFLPSRIVMIFFYTSLGIASPEFGPPLKMLATIWYPYALAANSEPPSHLVSKF